MLIHLKLENIALIEIIEINFEKGLNILTGDSGSGKSLILDSLNVLFGGTNIPLKHLIRPGKESCLIEAKFCSSPKIKDWLNLHGFKKIESEFIIRRITHKKKNKIISKYFINDLTINKKSLENLGPHLIDFAGQTDTFLFESHEYRKSIIDDLGSKYLKEINLEVRDNWERIEKLKGFLKEKILHSKMQEEKNFEIKNKLQILEEANLNSPNEILELEEQENKLVNNFVINNSIELILNYLNKFGHDEVSASFLIRNSIKQINKIVEFDKKIEEFSENLFNIQNNLENLIFDLNSYIQQFKTTDMSLEDIQKRLFFLKNLEKTFLLELPQIIEKRNELKTFFLNNQYQEEVKTLEEQINCLNEKLNFLFVSQCSERKKAAKELENSVISTLKDLGLENANFSVNFDLTEPSVYGINNINFLFSANPDQKLAPLSKVISGGEMSRFLLAIKSSISKKPNTFFLDEIDNGLSGKSLFSLVKLIKRISKEKQVLCITHQPFVAAAGKVHFKVKKKVIDGLTYTSISKLTTKEERQSELIDLIGGGFSEANDYASILLERGAA